MAMTIGQMATGAGVNIQTVRYYERRGLLPRAPQTASGYRQYDPDAVARLRFIKRATDSQPKLSRRAKGRWSC